MRAYGDFAQSIKIHMIANPGMITDRKLPRIGYSRRSTNNYSLADRRAEGAQQESAPGVHKLW